VQALVQALHAAAARLPATPLSLVHGDFHPEQVWVHEGRPLLFDFDEFALGKPMEDLASFITRLQQGPNAARAAAGETALLQGYRQAAPARWHAPSLQWHLVLQALLQTSRAFVFQVPGWPAELARRLSVAEARAHEMQEHLE
jgi:aminoglycoside phosphotransferase (APT) family kinase protein